MSKIENFKNELNALLENHGAKLRLNIRHKYGSVCKGDIVVDFRNESDHLLFNGLNGGFIGKQVYSTDRKPWNEGKGVFVPMESLVKEEFELLEKLSESQNNDLKDQIEANIQEFIQNHSRK